MDEIINSIINEISEKKFPLTARFLEVHELVYEKSKPKTDRVDTERTDGTTVVYCAVKDQNFHLAFYVGKEPLRVVTNVTIVPYSSISFVVSSFTHSQAQLMAMTKIEPTAGHNKGDKKWIGREMYKDSAITIEPHPEPDEFDSKLHKLLTVLEQDKEGVLKLAQAGGAIQAVITYHNDNNTTVAPQLNEESRERMAALGLAIDFDLYATGNKWKE